MTLHCPDCYRDIGRRAPGKDGRCEPCRTSVERWRKKRAAYRGESELDVQRQEGAP